MKPIVICGPTASGKTDLALNLARQLNAIIISADSRQVYKHLAIGTTKPVGLWKNGVYYVEDIPHYLMDFLEPTDTFNAGNFAVRTKEIISANPNTPIIFVGGTGMYLHSYFVGMDELPSSTQESRNQVEKLLGTLGKEGLHNFLNKFDPISAEQIPLNNIQRTMRAVELYLLTGKPASQLKSGKFFELPSTDKSSWIYLNLDKEILNKRIEKRTNDIFKGMIEETKNLLKLGYSEQVPALKSLGYPLILQVLRNEISEQDALLKITTLTKQYAKRQRTWFNRYTNAIKYNPHQETAIDFINKFLNQTK